MLDDLGERARRIGEIVVSLGDRQQIISGRRAVEFCNGAVEYLPHLVRTAPSSPRPQLVWGAAPGGTVRRPLEPGCVSVATRSRLRPRRLGQRGKAGTEASVWRRHAMRLECVAPALLRRPEGGLDLLMVDPGHGRG